MASGGATFDINRYALSLEIQLDMGPALSALDDLGVKAGKLEADVAEAAQRSLGSIQAATDRVSQSMAELSRQFAMTADATKRTVPNVEKIHDFSKEMYDQQLELSDDRKPSRDYLTFQRETLEEISNLMKEQGKLGTSLLDAINKVAAAIELKNRGHEDQNREMEQSNDLAKVMKKELDDVEREVRGIHGGFRNIGRALLRIVSFSRLVNQETENFVTANYRVYGSQQQIVEQTARLTERVGLLREETILAYQALGNMRVPRDQLDKYAEAVGMTSRVTGVGAETLAQFASEMRQTGYGAGQTNRELSWMAQNMRRLGLSTADMERTLSQAGVSATRLAMSFKEGADAPALINRLKMSYEGLGKQIGMNAEGLNQFMDSLSDPMERLKFGDMVGVSINSVQDMDVAVRAAGKQMQAMRENIATLSAAGMGDAAAEATVEYDIFVERLFGGNKAAAELASRLDELTVAEFGTVDAFRAATFTMTTQEKAAADLAKMYAESTQNTFRQIQQLWSKLEAIFTHIQFWAEGFIGPVLKYAIIPLVSVIAWAFNIFDSVIRSVDSLILSFTEIPGVMRFVLGAIIVIIPAVIALAASFRLLGRWFGWLGGSGTRLGSIFANLGNLIVGVFTTIGRAFSGLLTTLEPGFAALMRMVVQLASALGTALLRLAAGIAGAIRYILMGLGSGIQALLTGIGRGIGALGAQVMPVIPAILALGAALLLAGAGAYFFAAGAVMLADKGWAGVGALAALAVTLGLLGLALVALGAIAMPVIPGLLAVGAALLMVGAAAWLIGAGLEMAAHAFMMIVDAIGPHSPPLWEKLILVTVGIAAVAAAAIFGTGPIFALGVSLLTVAAAAAVVVLGVAALAVIVRSLVSLFQMVAGTLTGATASFGGFLAAVGQGALLLAGVVAAAWAFSLALAILGPALLAFGGLVAPVTPVLFVLAAAFLLVGAAAALLGVGMWLVAQAFSVVVAAIAGVDIGTKLLELAWGMGAVSLAALPFAAALAALAMVAMYASGPLVVLGLAMLALGAGVALVGAGTWLIAKAMQMMGEVSAYVVIQMGAVSLGLALLSLSIPLAAAALISLGIAAALSAGPLFVLGLALIPVGAAAWLLSRAFATMMGALSGIMPAVSQLGGGLLLVAPAMLAAGIAAGVLAAGLAALAGVGLVATPALLILSGVLVILGGGATLLGGGLTAAAAALATLGGVAGGGAGAALSGLGAYMAGAAMAAFMLAGSLLLLMGVVAVAILPLTAAVVGLGIGLSGAAVALSVFTAAATLVTAGLWWAMGTLERLGAALMGIGTGSRLMAEHLGTAAGRLGQLLSLSEAVGGALRGMTAWLAAVRSGTGDLAGRLGQAASALTSSLPAASAAAVVWASLGMTFHSLATDAAAASTDLTRLVAVVESTGTRLEAGFRRAARGADGLRDVNNTAVGVASTFETLAQASDRLGGVQQTAINLDVAVSRLAATGSRMQQVRDSFRQFAAALQFFVGSISGDTIVRLRAIGQSFGEFSSRMSDFTASLDGTSAHLNNAGTSFSEFSNRMAAFTTSFNTAAGALRSDNLVGPLTSLDTAASRFSASLSALQRTLQTISLPTLLDSQVAGMDRSAAALEATLTRYASLVENASARVEAAVVNRALPALRAARDSGIEDVVRAETIATVQVTHEEADTERQTDQDDMGELIDRVTELTSLLKTLIGNAGDNVAVIRRVVETYVPELVDGLGGGDSGLASELNNWSN